MTAVHSSVLKKLGSAQIGPTPPNTDPASSFSRPDAYVIVRNKDIVSRTIQ